MTRRIGVSKKDRQAIVEIIREEVRATGGLHATKIGNGVGLHHDVITRIAREDEAAGGFVRRCQTPGCPRTIASSAGYKFKRCEFHAKPRIVETSAEAKLVHVEAIATSAAHTVEASIVRVDTVRGWPLSVVSSEGCEEALVEDEELGRRLGFERPRKVRELIERHREALGGVSALRRGAEQAQNADGSGHKFRPYLLTEAQACFLAAKSETPNATELLKGMIAVFLAWKNGKLAPMPLAAVDDARLARFEGELADIRALVLKNARTEQTVDAVSARVTKFSCEQVRAEYIRARNIRFQPRAFISLDVLAHIASATIPGDDRVRLLDSLQHAEHHYQGGRLRPYFTVSGMTLMMAAIDRWAELYVDAKHSGQARAKDVALDRYIAEQLRRSGQTDIPFHDAAN